MRTVAIFTTTRAEFGIFIPFIHAIHNSNELNYKLFVGGTHLKDQYGATINEIRTTGYDIADTFDYLSNEDTGEELTKSLANETKQLASLFEKEHFDFVCVLGDRYELLPIVQTAIIYRKPIIHIHGGEATQGAIDEQIRHMITKAAHIHFVSCDEYYKNVRKMGEQEWRIFNTGALAMENINRLANLGKQELYDSLKLDTNRKTALLTYHPVTLERKIPAREQIRNVFNGLDKFDLQVLITAPNMDSENNTIMEEIQLREADSRYRFMSSLGAQRYLSLLKHVDFVIGNSSSGIIEVPYFKIPTINIGIRQDGRIRHNSIIDCNYDEKSIKEAIEKALSSSFEEEIRNMTYKFGDGSASQKMVEAIKEIANREYLMIKKLDFPC